MSSYPHRAERFWLPHRIKNFSSIAKYIECPDKTTLFWVGEPSDNVYFVEEGYLCVFHYTPEGETVTLLVHHTGDIVGVGGVLDNQDRAVCCETVGRCRLWVISAGDFFDLMYEYPELAIWMLADLSQRMKKIDQTVLRVVSMSAKRRIAVTLIDLCDKPNATHEDPAIVRLTHQELSNMIGICRQTATLFLGKFKEEGILNTRKGYMEIYDLNRLHEIADEEN